MNKVSIKKGLSFEKGESLEIRLEVEDLTALISQGSFPPAQGITIVLMDGNPETIKKVLPEQDIFESGRHHTCYVPKGTWEGYDTVFLVPAQLKEKEVIS